MDPFQQARPAGARELPVPGFGAGWGMAMMTGQGRSGPLPRGRSPARTSGSGCWMARPHRLCPGGPRHLLVGPPPLGPAPERRPRASVPAAGTRPGRPRPGPRPGSPAGCPAARPASRERPGPSAPTGPRRQPRGHQVGIDRRRHHVVGGERQHRIHRPRRGRPHLHHPVRRRRSPPAASRSSRSSRSVTRPANRRPPRRSGHFGQSGRHRSCLRRVHGRLMG